MKKLILCCSLVLGTTGYAMTAAAGASNERYDAASAGFVLNGGNSDFSVGLGLTSPWFAGSSIAVQGALMQSWFMHGVDKKTGEEEWVSFGSYKLGMMGGSVTENGFMRMYGAGGLLVICPNTKISGEGSEIGSYGAFGFEFFSGHSVNYYIELGANGIGTRADKLPGKPLYSNGFSSTVGFRYYL